MTVREWCNFNASILVQNRLVFYLWERDKLQSIESAGNGGEIGRAELSIPEALALFGKYELLAVFPGNHYEAKPFFVLHVRAKYWRGNGGKFAKHKEGDPGDG